VITSACVNVLSFMSILRFWPISTPAGSIVGDRGESQRIGDKNFLNFAKGPKLPPIKGATQ